jgi:hypothetical protein
MTGRISSREWAQFTLPIAQAALIAALSRIAWPLLAAMLDVADVAVVADGRIRRTSPSRPRATASGG